MSSPRTPGVLVDQRFELVTRMDDRGYGESWKALDRRFKNRLVMLKFLRPVRGVELPEELSDHINTLRALKHGNVLATVGHGLHQGSPFLVHEHFEGRSLGAGLDGARETGVLLPVRLLEGLFAMVSAAISAAHRGAKSVVHGGLNPGCVVIHRLPGEDFQVRVLDFGLHRFADPDPSAPARSARALLSLAPEQFDGRPATEATDVFGLGALLREMVSTPPEMGATMAPTTMNRRREDVPAAVWEAAGVALQPDPSQRFATVEDFLAEVQRAWQQSIEAAPALQDPAPAPAPAPRSLFATQHHEPMPSGPAQGALAAFAPASMPSPFRDGPALQMPSLAPTPTPTPAAAIRPVVVRPVENYAATMAISDLPPDSNPWDLAFDPAQFSQAAPRARSMDDLMQNIQRASQPTPHVAAPPPRPGPGRAAAAPDSTMLLSDEGPDLGATVVDHGPEPAAPGATMMLSPDAPGFGQMRPIAKSPTPTLPLGQSSFGPPTPGHAVDSTMMLPEPSGTGAPQSPFAGTMVLPGASEGAPVPWAAPRPPTLAPPSGPPGPQPWTPYAPPQSPQFETPPMMSTMHLRPPAAPQPEPRDPEATNHLLLVGGLSLVFLAVVGVVLKLVVFG